jgi:hypothetical protein
MLGLFAGAAALSTQTRTSLNSGQSFLVTQRSRAAILLHGLGRTARSMQPIAKVLERNDYDVLSVNYPSRTADIHALARVVAERVAVWHPASRLDFVTHSLGGILLRVAVADALIATARVRRVVMLGPPNNGSEIVNAFRANRMLDLLYARLAGPAGAQLGAGPEFLPAQLPPVDFEVGVIAGSRSYNPLFSALLGSVNDGKVRVESTRVAGMRDFIVVPHWHPLLMTAERVHHQTLRFLETGAFDHGA